MHILTTITSTIKEFFMNMVGDVHVVVARVASLSLLLVELKIH
jgi:hypothetical protein